MKFAIAPSEILLLVEKQLTNIFTFGQEDKVLLEAAFDKTLKRLEYNFSHSTNKYYSDGGETYFSPFHSGQYCIFLYYLSNEIWHNTQNNSVRTTLPDRLYFLNKMLNACDLFYEVELPEIFRLDHPVGSVMGRARYSDYFSFGQNCTVGNNRGIYPRLGHHVRMCANFSIIGDCIIGNNVTIGANACIKDQNIPDNSIVFGISPNLIIKPNNK